MTEKHKALLLLWVEHEQGDDYFSREIMLPFVPVGTLSLRWCDRRQNPVEFRVVCWNHLRQRFELSAREEWPEGRDEVVRYFTATGWTLEQSDAEGEVREPRSHPKPVDDPNPNRLGPALAPGSLGMPEIEATQFRSKAR